MTISRNTERLGMSVDATERTGDLSPVLFAALLAPLLLAAWQIEPLYASNQNTKYLHALASAGLGYLREDWLAGTKDGLPLFTWLVEVIYRTFGREGYYLAALGGYFGFLLCALVLFRRVTARGDLSDQAQAAFVAVIFVLATVEDAQRIAFGGFAKQYILSGYFQTADFGVLLLAGVLLFEARRLILACGFILLGAAMHPGYIAPGAVLIGAFLLYQLCYEPKSALPGLITCAAGLAGLALISLALKAHFAPTDPQIHREAHRILTDIRIPEHASPSSWIDINAGLQLAICAAAAWLLPPGRLRFVLRLGTAALVVFAAGAFLPGSETYRLVAPWRVSVILLPLASLSLCTLMVARLHVPGGFHAGNAARNLRLAGAAILCCVAVGLGFSAAKFAAPEPAYTAFVRATLGPGQHYLTHFEQIGFRLATGAPQYVNAKTHPYQDVEVLEWHRRLRVVQSLYRGPRMDCERLRSVAQYDRITHVIIDAGDPVLECPFAMRIFHGGGASVFHLKPDQL